ncbi:MAG: hypothetical protein GF344_04505 [Chitinivibrionales bacterium]|nr:hypothetical protein [Chitinivibrionales bacterium]
MNDELEIQKVLEKWAYNTRIGAQDNIVDNHSGSIVVYDVLPSMKYEGAKAYRDSWDEWQPQTKGKKRFDLHE